MTHRYINRTQPSDKDERTQLKEQFYAFVHPLISACIPDNDQTTAHIMESLHSYIEDLSTMFLRLNDDLAEGVISGYLVPYLVMPDTPFAPSAMTVGLGGSGGTNSGNVLCTVGLGLERRERREDGGQVATLLHLPEIVLDSVLDELMM